MIILADLANNTAALNIGGILAAFTILPFLFIALAIAINIWIIRAICKYMAKQNAKAFDYDYLAKKIAEEVNKKATHTEQTKEHKPAENTAEETV